MRKFFVIWFRELGACFLSPVAYVTMVAFLLLANWTFWHVVETQIGRVESLPSLLVMSMVLWLPVLATLVTMRLFAEEKRQGTLEILLTAPVTEWQVALGKYAGALSFVVIALAPSMGALYALTALAPSLPAPDAGAMAGGGVILFLLAAYCVAIGMFFSLLTRNQIIAAVCGFGGMVIPPLSGYLLSLSPFGPERLIRRLAVEDHLLDFARGVLDLGTTVLYVSGVLLLLFFSTRVLMLRRL